MIDVEGHLLGGEVLGALDQAHAIEGTADDAGLDQRFGVDDVLVVELAAVDVVLDAIEAHGVVRLDVRHVEATLGHAHVERHLAALEAVDGNAGARGLPLAAAAAGLALARADAASDAHAGLVGARIVPEFVETSHCRVLSLLRTVPHAPTARPVQRLLLVADDADEVADLVD